MPNDSFSSALSQPSPNRPQKKSYDVRPVGSSKRYTSGAGTTHGIRHERIGITTDDSRRTPSTPVAVIDSLAPESKSSPELGSDVQIVASIAVSPSIASGFRQLPHHGWPTMIPRPTGDTSTVKASAGSPPDPSASMRSTEKVIANESGVRTS